MKHIILKTTLSILLLSGCGTIIEKENRIVIDATLSNEDKLTLDSIGFDYEMLNKIRAYTDSAIFTLNTSFNFYNDSLKEVETTVKEHQGFSFKEGSGVRAREIVFGVKDELKKMGYLIYISEVNFGYDSDKISVIKSTDQFDILRIEETDGINYGLENKDVIAQLQKWNKRFPFQIIGAELDWVEAVFIEVPGNMKGFAKEIYDYCPDVVDQGTGSIEALEDEMANSGLLYLWWD